MSRSPEDTASVTSLWNSERRLWLEGIGAYEELMAPECIMAFGPMGLMRNQQIIESLRAAPRWSEVEMTDQAATRPAEGVAILAYKAHGIRDGARAYEAICTSSYVCVDGYWWIAHHQQTPIS